MKKTLAFVLIFALALTSVFANGSSEQAASSAAGSAIAAKPAKEPTWPIEILVSTAASGDALVSLQESAAKFNASQDKYVVNLYRGGSYEDIATIVQTSTKSDIPDIFASSGNDTAIYINMADKLYVPVQDFIDAEGFDDTDIIEFLKGNYARDGKWQCWPLGNTSVGQVWNITEFAKAGVDVNTLTSYDKILEACDKYHEVTGRTEFYGLYMAKHIDWINYAFSAINIDWYDNNNGRAGTPTKAYYGEGEVKQNTIDFFAFVYEMVKRGYALPYAKINLADDRVAFAEGSIIAHDAYSSGLTSQIKAIETAGFTDDWCFIPSPVIRADQENNGQSPGGGALFIANSGDYWREMGAWEFMKYLQTAEAQISYSMASGYVPTSHSAQNSAEYQDYIKNVNPSAGTIIEFHNATKVGVAYAPVPWSSDGVSAYKEVAKKFFDNPNYTAEDAAAEFAAKITEVIELYRLTNGL